MFLHQIVDFSGAGGEDFVTPGQTRGRCLLFAVFIPSLTGWWLQVLSEHTGIRELSFFPVTLHQKVNINSFKVIKSCCFF